MNQLCDYNDKYNNYDDKLRMNMIMKIMLKIKIDDIMMARKMKICNKWDCIFYDYG